MSTELVSLEAFLPDILTELPDCPVPAAERRIRDAVIEACERSYIWRHQLPEIPVQIGQLCFDLPATPGETRVHDIIRLFINRQPLSNIPLADTRDNVYLPIPDRGAGYHILTRGKIGLNQAPTRASDPLTTADADRVVIGIEAYASLKPTRDCNSIAQFIYDDYYQMVIDGALAYAFDMRDTPWYDPNQSGKRKVAFEFEIVKAKQALDRGFSDRPIAVRPRRF